MCVRTDCPLKPCHLLRLSDAAAECTGNVRWSMSAGPAEGQRAGIRFVTAENAWNGLRYQQDGGKILPVKLLSTCYPDPGFLTWLRRSTSA